MLLSPRLSIVLETALEAGIAIGIRRHYKHADRGPTEEEANALATTIHHEVMNSMHEWFVISDGDEPV